MDRVGEGARPIAAPLRHIGGLQRIAKQNSAAPFQRSPGVQPQGTPPPPPQRVPRCSTYPHKSERKESPRGSEWFDTGDAEAIRPTP